MIHIIAYFSLLCFWVESYKQLIKYGLKSEVSFSILSMTHWLMAFVYFYIIVFFQLDRDVQEKIFGNELTEIQLWFHVLTCSYFTFDLVTRFLKNSLPTWLFYHHLFTLIFIVIAVIQGQSGSENIYILRYATFCNVPMNIKIILANYGQNQTDFYHVCQLLYAGIYSFNFLYKLPELFIQFYKSNTSILTLIVLTVLCSQAVQRIRKVYFLYSKSSFTYFYNKYVEQVF